MREATLKRIRRLIEEDDDMQAGDVQELFASLLEVDPGGVIKECCDYHDIYTASDWEEEVIRGWEDHGALVVKLLETGPGESAPRQARHSRYLDALGVKVEAMGTDSLNDYEVGAGYVWIKVWANDLDKLAAL